MRWIRTAAVCALAVGSVVAGQVSAQTLPAFNREMVVIDPAHGGTDGGARLNDHLEEKDVTLAMAEKLRSLLSARGFTVVSTRSGDPSAALTNDQRAETANKARAVACIVLHASASGNGVYLGTSAIGSTMAAVPQNGPTTRVTSGAIPWDRAQEAYVAQSAGLANQVGAALARAKVPLAMGRIAMRPLDNLMCPALSIEVSSQHRGSDVTPINDEGYQQRIVEAIAGALIFWKNQAQQPEFLSVPRTGGGA